MLRHLLCFATSLGYQTSEVRYPVSFLPTIFKTGHAQHVELIRLLRPEWSNLHFRRSQSLLELTHTSRWSVGSVLFLASWAFLMGPYQYAVHLISGPRLPFTAAYFGSIFMTIFFAVGVSQASLNSYIESRTFSTMHARGVFNAPPVHLQAISARTSLPSRCSTRADFTPPVQLRSTILTLFSAIIQLLALVWYLVSYFPMGSTGLRFAARVGGGRVAAWMND